jgi:hypothetical protein
MSGVLIVCSRHGSCICVKPLSNNKLTLLAILTLYDQCFGEENFYYDFGIHRFCLVKNLTPLRVSPVRKRVRALKSKFALLDSIMKAHL